MNTLVIGGSRGIGWELAKRYAVEGDSVIVTGRKEPDKHAEQITFKTLDLSTKNYIESIEDLIAGQDTIDRLVFSPGYYQEGTITDLSTDEIEDMLQVCGSAFIFIARAVLDRQSRLDECIVITSSSQWTPRKLEPIYNYAKAGLGHFAHALSQDERVIKTLVAGPTGTRTAFHAGRNVDMSTYHEPEWVAEVIYENAKSNYKYRFVKILRNPAKVAVVEEE